MELVFCALSSYLKNQNFTREKKVLICIIFCSCAQFLSFVKYHLMLFFDNQLFKLSGTCENQNLILNLVFQEWIQPWARREECRSHPPHPPGTTAGGRPAPETNVIDQVTTHLSDVSFFLFLETAFYQLATNISDFSFIYLDF